MLEICTRLALGSVPGGCCCQLMGQSPHRFHVIRLEISRDIGGG